jgi:hypothetical protein
MKIFKVFALLLVSNFAFGQEIEKSKTPDNFNRLLVGINLSADYNTVSLSDLFEDGTFSNDFDKFEVPLPKPGFTAGVNLSYNFSKRLGLEFGFQYSNKGYISRVLASTIPLGLSPGSQVYGIISTPEGPIGGVEVVKYIHNFNYLDIPLRAIVSFGKRRIRFVASAGIAANLLLSTQKDQVLELKNGEVKRFQDVYFSKDYHSFTISSTLSMGVDFQLSKKINLRIEPTYRYGLLPIHEYRQPRVLWNYGLNLSCYYAIK